MSNNQNQSKEMDKFLGKLYDILVKEEIISFDEKPKDLKEKNQRLEKYLSKLERVQEKGRHLDYIKELYYDRYIIKEENISPNYWSSLEQRYLNEGHGHINLNNPQNDIDRRVRQEHISVIIRDQKESLDTWLNYLLSKDSDYLPMWAKVWAFQGMLGIGNLNENKDGYNRRSGTSINPFVEFDSEILGKCVELITESLNKSEMTDEEVNKLVSSGSFSKLYGKLLANKKQLKIVSDDGIWVKYNYETEKQAQEKEKQGIEPEYMKLFKSLQGYNTGWCTAGSKKTAEDQICGLSNYSGGDFYVYYTMDENGDYKIPRIAIRMNKNIIGEIRGIASNQNLETSMENVLEEKLKEFPDAEAYKKRVSDMKTLTTIYQKHQNKEELTRDDLMFLYEIEEKIQGFGYRKDPRVKEILSIRDMKGDLAKLFECSKEEIGIAPESLGNRQLRLYYGLLDLSDKYNAKGLIFPEKINGSLELSSLKSVEGLVLPKQINGDLILSSLSTVKGVKLPEEVTGDLDLSSLTSAEGLTLPEKIGGSLNLGSLTNTEGLKLPKIVNGYLDLGGLSTVKGLKLPEEVTGSLNLSSLTSTEGLTLPKEIDGSLYLESLEFAKNLVFPKHIGGDLILRGLNRAENLIFPEKIDGELDLSSLSSARNVTFPRELARLDLDYLEYAEELKLPEKVGGYYRFYGLTVAKNLTFPRELDGDLEFNNLISVENVVFPEKMGGSLDLSSLTTAEGLVLPKQIGGDFFLSSLTSVKGLVLPEIVGCGVYLNDLSSAEGLILPKQIGGDLDLGSLTSADGLKLPEQIDGDLFLSSLINTGGLALPEQVTGDLDLSSLTSVEGLTLPRIVDGELNLSSLTTTEGLTIPENHHYGKVIAPNLNIDNDLDINKTTGRSK